MKHIKEIDISKRCRVKTENTVYDFLEEVSDEDYQKQREELKQFMTPTDISSYMKSWRHDYEL